MSPRLALPLLFLLASGCAIGTQRAAVSAAPAGVPLAPTLEAAQEFVVDTSKSRFEVWGEDIMSGDHRITFKRWTARVKKKKEPEIHAEIETCTAEVDITKAIGIVRYDLLECDRFPSATLDATMKPTGSSKPNEQLVEGISTLHGVRKKLRFTGLLSEEGSGADRHYRFTAAFVISRKTFNIRYGPAEPFLKDDVRIVIDVVAVPAPPRSEAPAPPAPEEVPRAPALRTWGAPEVSL